MSRAGNLRRVVVGLPAGIFIAEVIAMLVVFDIRAPYWLTIMIDAVITTGLMIPLIYLLSYRPLLVHVAERERTQDVLQFRLRVVQFAESHTLDELLQMTLDEMEDLTESKIGFFHFLESDQVTLWKQAWSTRTIEVTCRADGGHSNLDRAGVWARCVQERNPVVFNDFPSVEGRHGTPDGHAVIGRQLTVPILREDKVVAIFGMGNKASDYTQEDVELVSALTDFAWDIIGRKRALDALVENEERFRTLVDWTYSWESWVDPNGDFVYISPSCERSSGYRPEDFIASPSLSRQIVHPEDRTAYEDHMKLVHDGTADVSNLEYRIIDREGNVHWIDHICRPLYSEAGSYLGRRVSNREITHQKLAEKEIQERNQKEALLTQTIYDLQLDIARDLHDTLGQNISYLRMKLDYLTESELDSNTDLKTEFRSMLGVADKSYDLVRGTLDVLQSEGLFNPVPLFHQYAAQLGERATFNIKVTSRGDVRPLTPSQVRQLFFIFREALNNIEKHAKAQSAAVDLEWGEDKLTLAIRDDGVGFNQEDLPVDSHFGLRFMRERVDSIHGELNLQSRPGEGTLIEISLPHHANAQDPH